MTVILSYNQQTDILQDAYDLFATAEPDTQEITEVIFDVVDAWVPVYNNHILDQWQLAGCPEPTEIMTIKEARNIFHAMSVGLWETASDYLHSFLASCLTLTDARDKISEELDERERNNR